MGGSGAYKTLESPVSAILREKSSRFLAFVSPVSNVEEAENQLVSFRKEYFDSRHVCFAWRIGDFGEISRAYDAGEPAHSAGDPILNALRSKELTYVLAVVIRYFGGTKLGIPGLIEAYRGAVDLALDQAKIIEVIPQFQFSIRYPYEKTSEVNKALHQTQAQIVGSHFEAECHQILQVPKSNREWAVGIFEKLGILED